MSAKKNVTKLLKQTIEAQGELFGVIVDKDTIKSAIAEAITCLKAYPFTYKNTANGSCPGLIKAISATVIESAQRGQALEEHEISGVIQGTLSQQASANGQDWRHSWVEEVEFLGGKDCSHDALLG